VKQRRLACTHEVVMKPVGVLYATREGHTANIAARVAGGLRSRGVEAVVKNLVEGPVDPLAYAAVIVASPVHIGKHEPAVSFVKNHLRELAAIPVAFLSVLLAQAGAEMRDHTPERRAQARAEVQQVLDRFFAETGWRPAHVKPIAGALMYSKYNFFIRMVMKWIAWRSGGSSDSSRDHIYTDWAGLDRFVVEFAEAAKLFTPNHAKP
jgi:menaquinone-dependent protoporphyrinogen oxidase